MLQSIMIKKLIFICLFFAGGIVILPQSVFAQYEVKDSFYFMKNDGIFSSEEKDEEAEYIKRQCETSTYQPIYFDCTCIAGAFRAQRDEEKLKPQSFILNNLYNDPKTKCANTVGIAGDSYSSCMISSKVFRDRGGNNEDYCTCVANKVATEFTANPRLNTDYISDIKVNSALTCNRTFKAPN